MFCVAVGKVVLRVFDLGHALPLLRQSTSSGRTPAVLKYFKHDFIGYEVIMNRLISLNFVTTSEKAVCGC